MCPGVIPSRFDPWSAHYYGQMAEWQTQAQVIQVGDSSLQDQLQDPEYLPPILRKMVVGPKSIGLLQIWLHESSNLSRPTIYGLVVQW